MRMVPVCLLYLFSFFFFAESQAVNKKEKEETIQSCRYIPSSITRTNLAGVDLSKGVSVSTISRVGAIMAENRSSVPLDFLINLDVVNPNVKNVSLYEFEYVLLVDNLEFTRGVIKKTVKIPATRSKVFPVPINLELTKLLQGNTSHAVQNMVKNFMGSGGRPTNIMLYIKPSYKIGKQIISSSQHIPVNFSLGGRN